MSSADKNSETLTQRTPAKTDSTQISESNTSSKLSNLPIKTNFILNGYEHDQNTFLGRLRHQLETTNPKLMVTPEAEIRASIKLLKDFKYDPENVLRRKDITDRDLWRAQTIKRSSTNADTDEIIYQPFRLCGFVTWNMPVLIGLLWPNPSTATVFFWQWMNQNHNAAVNFANRNASNPTDPKLLAGSYVAACAGALSVPYYLNKTIRSSVKLTEAKKLALLRYTPFPSVVVANSINMFFMRSKELTDGIPVTDSETGEMVGSSKKAAFNAIAMTAPIIEKKFAKSKFLPGAKLGALAMICAACFYAVLPVSVAAFPQYVTMDKSGIEPELAKKVSGQTVIYNRGQ